MEEDGDYKEWYYQDEVGTWQIAGYVLQDEFIKFMTVKVCVTTANTLSK